MCCWMSKTTHESTTGPVSCTLGQSLRVYETDEEPSSFVLFVLMSFQGMSGVECSEMGKSNALLAAHWAARTSIISFTENLKRSLV